jgi:hypothetical protein
MDDHLASGATMTPEGDQKPGPTDSEPNSRGKRRHRVLEAVGAITLVLVAIGFIGAIAEQGDGEIFSESFDSDEVGFSTDSDRFVDLSVVDDAYQVTIKDGSIPQVARYVFEHTYDGLSFEATIVHQVGAGGVVFASVGCWAGESAYQLLMAPNGDVGLLETVRENTGERRELTELIPVDAARPAGQPNRLEIDCVGGGKDETIVSGYVNGEPVLSVAIPDGYDSFNAVGFFMVAERGGRFTIDDVTASSGQPQPAMSPAPPREDR